MGVPGHDNKPGYHRSETTCDRCAGSALKCGVAGITARHCDRCVKAGVPCEWSFRSKSQPRQRVVPGAPPAKRATGGGSVKRTMTPRPTPRPPPDEELPMMEKPGGRRSRYRKENKERLGDDQADTLERQHERDLPSSDLSDAPSDGRRQATKHNGRQRVRSDSANVRADEDPHASQRRRADERGSQGHGQRDREEYSQRKLAVKPPRPAEKSTSAPNGVSPSDRQLDAHNQPEQAEESMAGGTAAKGLKRKSKVVSSSDEDDNAPASQAQSQRAGPSRSRDASSARPVVQKVKPDSTRGSGSGFFDSTPAAGGLKLKISMNANGGPQAHKVAAQEETKAPAEHPTSKRPRVEKQHSGAFLSTGQPERKKKRRGTDSGAEEGVAPPGGADMSKPLLREQSKRRTQHPQLDFTESESEAEANPRRKRKSNDAEYQREASSDGEGDLPAKAAKAPGKVRGKQSVVVSDAEGDPEEGSAPAPHKQVNHVKREEGKSAPVASAGGTPDAVKDKLPQSNGSKTGTPVSEAARDRAPVKKTAPAPAPKKALPPRDTFADTLMRMSGVASGASTPAKKEEKPATNGKTSLAARFRVEDKEERNRKRNELYTSAPTLNLMAGGHAISSYETETRSGSAFPIGGRRDDAYINVKSTYSTLILQGLIALKDREGLFKAA